MIFLCFWNKLFLYERYKVIFAAKFRFSIIENLSGLKKDLSKLHLNRIDKHRKSQHVLFHFFCSR